jgi:hypothetical protein
VSQSSHGSASSRYRPGLTGSPVGQSVVCRAHLVTQRGLLLFWWCWSVKLSLYRTALQGRRGGVIRGARCACNVSSLRVSSGAFQVATHTKRSFARRLLSVLWGVCSFWPGRGMKETNTFLYFLLGNVSSVVVEEGTSFLLDRTKQDTNLPLLPPLHNVPRRETDHPGSHPQTTPRPLHHPRAPLHVIYSRGEKRASC